MKMDKDRFKKYCLNHIKSHNQGIGTYKEKTLHNIIKMYYEDDDTYQEVKVGKYVADICKGKEIIEVQTKAFNKLVFKLEEFLTNYQVKIIYPIAYNKWLSWIDDKTKEVVSRRKSPKIGRIYDCFKELYRIKKYLNNQNCTIVLFFVDIEESRNLNGWSKDKKRGSVREDQIPVELVDEVEINDFHLFIPYDLPTKFTSKDYAQTAKQSLRNAQIGLNILQYVKVIKVIGKSGRSNLYQIIK